MSWHRDENGLYCACFLAYQPDDGTDECPAYPCPHLDANPAAIREFFAAKREAQGKP